MDFLVVVLRLLHIVFGVLWVGFACFVPFILLPSLMDAGPAAGPLMGAIQRRGLPKIMSAFAGITILAGFLLLWRVSSGFSPEFMGSHMGIALSTGALSGLIAFAIGFTVVKPAMTNVALLSERLPTATESERGALVSTIGALRARGAAVASGLRTSCCWPPPSWPWPATSDPMRFVRSLRVTLLTLTILALIATMVSA